VSVQVIIGLLTLALCFAWAIWSGRIPGKALWIWFWWQCRGYRGCYRNLLLHAEMEARRVQ